MDTPRHQFTRGLWLSLFLTLLLTVPAAYVIAPHYDRWSRLQALTSASEVKRQSALQYVADHAGTDGRVLAGAINHLDDADDQTFTQIAMALQTAGCWQREQVGNTPWLRWLAMLIEEVDVESGSLAAQRLGRLHDLADEPRVIGILGQLAENSEPDVRLNALSAAAGLAMSARDRHPYHALVQARTQDDEPLIAEHAWLFADALGLPTDEAPPVLRSVIQASRLPVQDEKTYGLDAIRALLVSPDAPLRDVGCVLAVRDLEVDALDALIESLLTDLNDDAVMSGAILSGMTGRHTSRLRDRTRQEDKWAVMRVLAAGLWMQGDTTHGIEPGPAWFLGHELPRTTGILALLRHKDTQTRALDQLLNPQGEAPDDLARLLDDYGWWRVLNHYLPEHAPNWQPGTTDDIQRTQIELLREWFVVHRQQIIDNSGNAATLNNK